MNQIQIDLYLLCTLIYTSVVALFTLIINFCPRLSRDFSVYEENGTFLLVFQVIVSIAAVLDFFTNAIRYYRRKTLTFKRPKWTSLLSHIVPTIAAAALCITFFYLSFTDKFMVKLVVWTLLIFLLNLSQISVLVLRYIVHYHQ